MTAQPAREVVVEFDVNDGLPDVLARLRGLHNRPVHLVVPPGSPLLLTAVEFRSLRDAIDGRGLALTLHTDDPLRRQLSAVFGIATPGGPEPPAGPAAPPRSDPQGGDGTGTDSAPKVGPWPTDRQREADGGADRPALRSFKPIGPVGSSTAPPVPAGGRSKGTSAEADGRSEAPPAAGTAGRTDGGRDDPRGDALSGWQRPVAGRAERGVLPPLPPDPADRTGRPAFGRPSPAGVDRGAEPDEELRLQDVPTWRRGGRSRRPRGRALAVLVGALVGLAAVFAAVSFFFLTRATVELRLREQPVAASVTYLVATGEPSEGDAAFVVPAESQTKGVRRVFTAPTSGTRPVPDQAAGGVVRLANPTEADVVLEAGTDLEADDGAVYRVVEAVTVPGRDEASGAAGAGEATVQAVEPGTAGNREPGGLSGRHESGVYFSNRDAPIAGGTDRPVPTVAQADLAALREAADAEFAKLTDEDLLGIVGKEVPAGRAVVPGSANRGQATYDFGPNVGEDGESVELLAILPVTFLTYDPAAAETQATEGLRAGLEGETPEGFELDAASVQTAPPEATAEGDGQVRVTVRAEGRARARFAEAERDDLRDRLAGEDADGAAAVLRGVPAAESFAVDYSPGWLPDRMPRSADRIEIEVGTETEAGG